MKAPFQYLFAYYSQTFFLWPGQIFWIVVTLKDTLLQIQQWVYGIQTDNEHAVSAQKSHKKLSS